MKFRHMNPNIDIRNYYHVEWDRRWMNDYLHPTGVVEFMLNETEPGDVIYTAYRYGSRLYCLTARNCAEDPHSPEQVAWNISVNGMLYLSGTEDYYEVYTLDRASRLIERYEQCWHIDERVYHWRRVQRYVLNYEAGDDYVPTTSRTFSEEVKKDFLRHVNTTMPPKTRDQGSVLNRISSELLTRVRHNLNGMCGGKVSGEVIEHYLDFLDEIDKVNIDPSLPYEQRLSTLAHHFKTKATGIGY